MRKPSDRHVKNKASDLHALLGTLVGIAALIVAILSWLSPFIPVSRSPIGSRGRSSVVASEITTPQPSQSVPNARQAIVLPNHDYGMEGEGGRSAEASVTLEPNGILAGSFTII